MPVATANYQYIGSALCPDCGNWYDDSDGCIIGKTWSNSAGRTVCPNCAEVAGYVECAGCGDFVLSDDSAVGSDGENYCESCFEDTFFVCPGCNEVYHQDSQADGELCSGCYEDSCHEGSGQTWEADNFIVRNNSYERIGSRGFGVEIETSNCDGYSQLEYDSDFQFWGVKNDCSISGMEFVSAILSGDKGLAEVEHFTRLAENNDWQVDDGCGLHVHFDMRHESNDGMKAIVLAYYLTREVWEGWVDSYRVGNRYCKPDKLDLAKIAKITSISDFVRYWNDRQTWINYSAFYRHGSFEVRLHHGSIDGREICAWIIAHSRFMDWASRTGFDGVKKALWIKSRAEKRDFITDLGGAEVANFYG